MSACIEANQRQFASAGAQLALPAAAGGAGAGKPEGAKRKQLQQIVPRVAAAGALVSAGELLAAVRQASIVVNETSRGVQFTFVDNGLMLAARSADYGESTVTAELSMAGITATVRLDPTFVAGWLRNVDPGAIIEVFATDAESAVVLRHEDALSVVMPLAAE